MDILGLARGWRARWSLRLRIPVRSSAEEFGRLDRLGAATELERR